MTFHVLMHAYDAADSHSSLAAPSNPLLEKYTEQWTTVQETPSDFNTWTALISTTEKLVSNSLVHGTLLQRLPCVLVQHLYIQ
jgi:hypothetical protein